MARPQISALLPIKDGAQYVNQIMLDLIACTNSGDEIIVVNDNSTDTTAVLLNDWAAKYNTIRVVNSRGQGLVSALNTGIALATNEWIARFDCDDRYPSHRLEEQLSVIESDLACIFTDYEIYSADGKSLGVIPSPVSPIATRLSLWRNLRTPHPSAVINKEKALLVGAYAEEDFLAEDLSLWLRLSKVGKLQSTPSVLLKYTLSSSSITGSRYFDSKEKAKSIYLKQGIDVPLLRQAMKNFKRQAKDYEALPMSRERTLLHYIDVIANGKIMQLPKAEIMVFALKNFQAFYPLSGISIFRNLLRRRLNRKLKPTNSVE